MARTLKQSVSIGAVMALLSATSPARAAVVDLDATISYTTTFGGPGDLLFQVTYDDQAADEIPNRIAGSFPLLTFDVRGLSGPLAGGSVSSSSGATGRIIQSAGGIFRFAFSSSSGINAFQVGGISSNLAFDANRLTAFDLNDLQTGEGYGYGTQGFFPQGGGLVGIAFNVDSAVTNVPLPSSLALMGLVVGGAAMRSAAKARRAARKRKAS
ncbi:MAG: hypothetical protein AAGH74_02365 [Pseudomonadota bacterium]